MFTFYRPSLLLCMLVCGMTANAQVSYEFSRSIPVSGSNGAPLANFWAGGMNAPQFSSSDLNFDGLPDLVVFDRQDNSFVVYRNDGPAGYTFDPKLTRIFDRCECDNWALLKDYNCDGLPDLFCGQTSYVKVYDQVLAGADSASFELSYDYVYAPFPLWMYSSSIDLPALVDVDKDGDLDILAFNLLSNYVTWYRNMAQETYNRCDTLAFEIGSPCFGHFFEANNNNDIFLHDTLFCPLSNGFSPGPLRHNPQAVPSRHAGSTVLALDLTGNGLYDVLIGDISYTNGVAVFNHGQLDYAYMTAKDFTFPSYNDPFDLYVFPAFFYEDINGDGKRDLIGAPNLANSLSENVDGLLWYLNVGRDDSAVFQAQGRSFLIPKGYDAGSNSTVAFLDENADGLMDMLVGNRFAFYQVNGQPVYQDELHLLRNVGAPEAPAFRLITRNYLNVNSGTTPRLTGLAPVAGDIDGDGDVDLLIGNAFGEVMFFRNDAGPGLPASFTLANGKLGNIDVGNFASPALLDFDNDGDLDLFIGNEGGTIAYYRNDGNLSFSLAASQFGNIKVSNQFNQVNFGSAAPAFADWNGDGLPDLILGQEQGFVDVYTSIQTGLTDSLFPTLRVLDRRFGTFTSPAAAVIDSSGFPTLVIGESRGGLYLVSPRPDAIQGLGGLRTHLPLAAFPNPVTDALTIRWESSAATQVRISTSMGAVIFSAEMRPGESELSVDASRWPAGVYFLQVASGSAAGSQKLVRR